MDVINAAKKISEAGTNLDKLTRQIADQCPESSTKKDLLAYLQRIALYCHQLNITSKVKADVQNISGELIVSGVSRTRKESIVLCGGSKNGIFKIVDSMSAIRKNVIPVICSTSLIFVSFSMLWFSELKFVFSIPDLSSADCHNYIKPTAL